MHRTYTHPAVFTWHQNPEVILQTQSFPASVSGVSMLHSRSIQSLAYSGLHRTKESLSSEQLLEMLASISKQVILPDKFQMSEQQNMPNNVAFHLNLQFSGMLIRIYRYTCKWCKHSNWMCLYVSSLLKLAFTWGFYVMSFLLGNLCMILFLPIYHFRQCDS